MNMQMKTEKKSSVIREIVEVAFKKTNSVYGISAPDLFAGSVAFAAIGLILVNIDWMPASFNSLGWSLIVIGVASMVLIRKLL